mmetsp:Transcript_31859/g.77637  ORF Transcript_31859/g.77637 Transcript_31859/m.77637 type:complete len:461 (+) Transcript_31859:118-1500(+)
MKPARDPHHDFCLVDVDKRPRDPSSCPRPATPPSGDRHREESDQKGSRDSGNSSRVREDDKASTPPERTAAGVKKRGNTHPDPPRRPPPTPPPPRSPQHPPAFPPSSRARQRSSAPARILTDLQLISDLLGPGPVVPDRQRTRQAQRPEAKAFEAQLFKCDGCSDMLQRTKGIEDVCVLGLEVDIFRHVICLCRFCTFVGKQVIFSMFERERETLLRSRAVDLVKSVTVWSSGVEKVISLRSLDFGRYLPRGKETTFFELQNQFFESLSVQMRAQTPDFRPVHRAITQACHLCTSYQRNKSEYEHRVAEGRAKEVFVQKLTQGVALLAFVLCRFWLPLGVLLAISAVTFHVFWKWWSDATGPLHPRQELRKRISSICSVDSSYWSWGKRRQTPNELEGITLQHFLIVAVEMGLEMTAGDGKIEERKLARATVKQFWSATSSSLVSASRSVTKSINLQRKR